MITITKCLDANRVKRFDAIRRLRGLIQLPLKESVDIIDQAINGGKSEIFEDEHSIGPTELATFISYMKSVGFTVTGDLEDTFDEEYYVEVSETPNDDLRQEVERRILLIIREQNIFNQANRFDPVLIPDMENMSDTEVLDLFQNQTARWSMPKA